MKDHPGLNNGLKKIKTKFLDKTHTNLLGLTSTTILRDKALGFADKWNRKDDQIPVLLEI